MKPRARKGFKYMKRYENRYRDISLSEYYDADIEMFGTFQAVNDVVKVNYQGKSVLFKEVMLDDNKVHDHMWIHLDHIKNPEILKMGQRYVIKGHVTAYYQNHKNKVVREKYTLDNVVLERLY